MLKRWLGEMPLEQFLNTHYLQTPFARPDAARGDTWRATWDKVAAIAAGPPPPDAMVVRDGRLLRVPAPRSRAALDALLGAGASLVLRGAEQHDAGLRELAEGFAAELRGRVAVQLYATPAGHHSFGWHYDAEEVFILQTIGEKEYLLRQNSVNSHPVLENMPRDMKYEREASPMFSCTLVPGDWLYIPAGYWHKARARTAALSISIGVFAPTALDLLDLLRARLLEDPRWRERLPLSPAQRGAALEELRERLPRQLADEALVEALFSAATAVGHERHAAR